jgi:beta-galactosidase
VDVPHDFVVEGNFSSSADKSHGYLPYGVGWYRKHFTPPAGLSGAGIAYITFDGVQTSSDVWLNGVHLGSWPYGYTGSRYFVNSTILHYGEENTLAVRVDATHPDGWWYDGGG